MKRRLRLLNVLVAKGSWPVILVCIEKWHETEEFQRNPRLYSAAVFPRVRAADMRRRNTFIHAIRLQSRNQRVSLADRGWELNFRDFFPRCQKKELGCIAVLSKVDSQGL
jgi:hypothetical protein